MIFTSLLKFREINVFKQMVLIMIVTDFVLFFGHCDIQNIIDLLFEVNFYAFLFFCFDIASGKVWQFCNPFQHHILFVRIFHPFFLEFLLIFGSKYFLHKALHKIEFNVHKLISLGIKLCETLKAVVLKVAQLVQ